MESSQTTDKIELRMGNYYQIIHKHSGKALMMRQESSNEYRDKSPVIGNPNDTDLNQVWMIENIKEKNSYELVHSLSTLVLENLVRSIKLNFGDWRSSQLFWIEPIKGEINNFIIKQKQASRSYFYADRDGVLQFGQREADAPEIVWILRIAQKTRAITQSVLFENAFTNMAMDVPEASSKPSVKIVQYPVNKRFNQRFKLVFNESNNTYIIENVKSKLVFDIREGSTKEGANIIQYPRHDGLNQRWFIENQGKDLYLVRSALNPELFIGIKNNEMKECAQLVTTKSEEFALWRIMGQFQKQDYDLPCATAKESGKMGEVDCEGLRFQSVTQVIFLYSIRKMAHNWEEDEFDFEGDANKKKARKDDPKKGKNSKSNDDFFDLEEDEKHVKLPVLGNKTNTNNTEKASKANLKIGLEQISSKKPQNLSKKKLEKDESFEVEYEQSIAKNPSVANIKDSKATLKKESNSPKKPEQEDEVYGEQQFEQEKYDEDFETHVEHKPSPMPFKAKQEIKKAPTVNLPKPAAREKRVAESVTKKTDNSARIQSRNSARSQDRTSNSRTKVEDKKDDVPNKYLALADKNCPFYQKSVLQEFSMDKVVRQNDKVRALIKKFNDELNDMINKNIMLLKNKKEEKVVVADDILKNLEETRNSNETVLQTTTKELQKLKGKEGELREEEYQLSIEQKITEMKTTISEYGKLITRLKLQINNEGNKLTKIDKENTVTQDIMNIKNNLVNFKREEEKNDESYKKLELKLDDLNKKIADADTRLNSQMDQAKSKGFSVANNVQLNKKAEQIKKKIENTKQHKSKIQALYKTKSQMIIHDLEQIKSQIKAIESSTQLCIVNCEETQGQSRKTVEKAKRNTKTSAQLIVTLQNIIAEMENGGSSSRDPKDQQSNFTHPKGVRKYQSQKNVEKIIPQGKEVEKALDDLGMKKPVLFKKKDKEEEKQEERVWTDEKPAETKKVEKPKEVELNKFEDKDDKKQEQKKKPFVIKRNKDSKPQEPQAAETTQRQSPKTEVRKDQVEVKTEQIPSIAPRMMKFKKNKDESTTKIEEPKKIPETNDKNQYASAPSQQSKPEVKPQQDEDKAIFAPKRFNLKLKDKKSQEAAAGYTSSVAEKKQEQKIVEEYKPKTLAVDKQSLVSQQAKKEPIKIPQPPKEEEQKPKFNLRLRDRQRQSNKVQEKIQIPIQPKIEEKPKFSINLNDNFSKPEPNISKQNNNPYAIQANEAAKRERQGPMKKPKVAPTTTKQNYNIYDQAEDITNMNQIKINEQPKSNKPLVSNDEPDLNKLLGINKKKQSIDEDLIVDSKLIGKGGKKQAKKDTNFFADLEL